MAYPIAEASTRTMAARTADEKGTWAGGIEVGEGDHQRSGYAGERRQQPFEKEIAQTRLKSLRGKVERIGGLVDGRGAADEEERHRREEGEEEVGSPLAERTQEHVHRAAR